jgi:hypothetical protein
VNPASQIPIRKSVSVSIEVDVEEPEDGWTVADAARQGWEVIRGLEGPPVVEVLIEDADGGGCAEIVAVDLEEVKTP